ncbi:MAG: polyprenyl synthetase family protein [Candidatus Neomarinimicrobiota bacterium]
MKKSTELTSIVEPILEDLKIFQKEFEDALKSEVRLINAIGHYLLRLKGKGIRPILTIFSARICGGPTLNSYKAAAIVELLHVASLMHDDVVDGAKIRRDFPTVNRIWKDKTSVIMGDFILSKVLSNLIRIRDFEVLDLISATAEKLSSGEMQQIEESFRKSMTEDVYYQMIRDKTAALISTCCELGVITSSKDESQKRALQAYGENFGMAFQIKDDLFDFLGSEEEMGKETQLDMTKNMITLPVIHTLSSELTPAERRRMNRILFNGSLSNDMETLKDIVDRHGGFDYAQSRIEDYSGQAVEALGTFPDTPYKKSLTDLTHYNTRRTR